MEVAFAREVLSRFPLAEAVLSLGRWVADPLFLLSVFARHSGTGYEVVIRVPQGKCEVPALVTTPLAHGPGQIREWFVRRGTRAVTCEEARVHWGLETQRQGNDQAIGRTTPAFFGRYSLVTLLAHARLQAEARVVRAAAWYVKVRPTFSEALAMVRDGKCGARGIFPCQSLMQRW